MNVLVLLAGAEKGQSLKPWEYGLVAILCQTCHHWPVLALGGRKRWMHSRSGPFYSISSSGTNTEDSVPLLPLPVPSHPSAECNSKQRTQPRCGHWPERIWVESSPAKSSWILWTTAKPSGTSDPGAGGMVQCRQSGFLGDLSIIAFSLSWEAMWC